MRTRVKICGITRVEDGVAAAHAGADAIGLVFHAASPRNVAPAQAEAIRRALPPFVSVVGLFVNAATEIVREVLAKVRLDALQFHGDEPAADCGRFGIPYIKAIRMRDDVNLHQAAATYDNAQALLLDTYEPERAGGTGRRFDWTRVPHDLPKPVILAGGLTPENLAHAIALVRPYAADVSGGVESAPGIKEAAKIAAFIKQARGTGL